MGYPVLSNSKQALYMCIPNLSLHKDHTYKEKGPAKENVVYSLNLPYRVGINKTQQLPGILENLYQQFIL